jgi:hypothetical protein
MPNVNSRNLFDKKDSLELGEKAESLFAHLALRLGWKISASTQAENINAHWDYRIANDEAEFKVEVKSAKRIRRNDGATQSAYVWVELRNVRGEIGWLFGKADLIAFEKETAFIFVKRLDLLATVNKKVNFAVKARDAKDALYKIYTRAGRKDKLTLLLAGDVEEIKFMEWKKEGK